MAEQLLPYVQSYGNITKVLNKIKAASTPPRFTVDYLATTLDMSGGGARPLIPFLKRTGFLGSDGIPTELYKTFRNPAQSGAAVAQALRTGYRKLYEANEYVHEAKDSDLRGLIVQVTGQANDSTIVKSVFGSFKALKAMADFSGQAEQPAESMTDDGKEETEPVTPAVIGTGTSRGVNLSYTINLHLPPTSDVAVFNAIFKSLREHILRD
jgi:Family of unknown function (DUF5343)